MREIYDAGIRKLEKFASDARLTTQQQIVLYQIARDFFEIPVLLYPVSRPTDSKQMVDAELRRALDEIGALSRDLMARHDRIGVPQNPTSSE